MKYGIFGVILVLLLAAGYWFLKDSPPVQPEAPPIVVEKAPAPVATPAEPKPERTPQTETIPENTPEPGLEEIPLPMLAESDTLALASLGNVIGEPAVERFIANDNVISRLVTTIDALGSRQIPATIQGVSEPGGEFGATANNEPESVIRNEEGDPIPQFTIDPANYGRYEPYVDLFEAADTELLIDTYRNNFSLVQEAYRMQGYPDGDFNARLSAVIDELLDTPRVRDPVDLIKPEAYFLFSDPDLESLSAGQKILLRMGDDNAERVKAKLEEIRKALL